jgi:hypothetical protein
MKNQAGVAQLVERDLAKVEVTSSSLVTRSSFGLFNRALYFRPQASPGNYLSAR